MKKVLPKQRFRDGGKNILMNKGIWDSDKIISESVAEIVQYKHI